MKVNHKILVFRLAPVLVAGVVIFLGVRSRAAGENPGEIPRSTPSESGRTILPGDLEMPGLPPGLPADFRRNENPIQVNTGIRSVTGLVSADRETLRNLLRTGTDARELQAAAWALGNKMSLEDGDVTALLDVLNRAGPRDIELINTTLWALSLRPDLFPMETARRLALHHESDAVRRGAVRAMGTCGGDTVVGTIGEVATKDANSANRSEAIFFLTAWIDPADAVTAAREGMAAETDGGVKASWLNLAASHGLQGSRALLEEALLSAAEPLEVRKMAAEMLAAEGRKQAEALSKDLRLPEAVRKHVCKIYLVKKSDKSAGIPGCSYPGKEGK